MNKYFIALGLLLCIAAVSSRHYTDRNDKAEHVDDKVEENDNADDLHPSRNLPRHRRKRWQMNYRYNQPSRYEPSNYPHSSYPSSNYPPNNYPPSSYYPDDRRDDRNQDVINDIYRLLGDIYSYIRRPPPPPQQPVIVVPVPYLGYPQRCNCGSNNGQTKPNITFPIRFPEMEDSNQNWGFVVDSQENFDPNDDGTDGMRPISFEPINNKRTTKRPPPVEHGTVEGAGTTTVPPPVPGRCDTAILSCCRPSDSRAQQRQCFQSMNCLSAFENGNACKPDNVMTVLETFSKAYSPITNN